MRTIGVVTVGRSDYGIYQPVLRAIAAHPELRLQMLVSGTHLSSEFGMTVAAIEADGFVIGDRIDMLLSSDSPEGIAKSMGLGTIGFAQAFARSRPDLLVVLGDRFDMFVAALAALPFRIPVAHIHGGELTRGAIDDSLRHAMTKLSHLHFVSTAEYGRRVAQLGEEPWRIVVCGAPALDQVGTVPNLSPGAWTAAYGAPVDPPPLLVTFHPVTLEYEQVAHQVDELLAAVDAADLPAIFTQPNADTGRREVSRAIDAFVATHPRTRRIDNLGMTGYFSLMKLAAAMVGNSSSGLIEAPSFALPVVNIGTRQSGRVRSANVIDVACSRDAILDGIRRATAPGFRASLAGIANPYGDGHAADAIVRHIATVALDERLTVKVFQDLPAPDGARP